MNDKNLITMPAGVGLMSDIMYMRENENYTKVSFPCDDEEVISENMWVRIMEGDQTRGYGCLDNEPAYVKYVKHQDFIDFALAKDDDIRPTFVCKLSEEEVVNKMLTYGEEDELPCLREKEPEDGEWSCVNDHTGCLWNDGHNGCGHAGNSTCPLGDGYGDEDERDYEINGGSK